MMTNTKPGIWSHKTWELSHTCIVNMKQYASEKIQTEMVHTLQESITSRE